MAPPSPDESSTPDRPSPSDTTTSLPPEEPTSPLFKPTTRPPSDDLSTSSPPPPSSDLHDADPLSPSLGAGSRSGPRSTGSFKARELRETARAAVSTVGGIVHRFLTRKGTPERQLGLYLPDKDDTKAIGDPVASLASRRIPEGAKNADVMDLLRAGLGVLAYLSKQAEKKIEAEEIRYSLATLEPDDQGDDHDEGTAA